MAHGIITTGGRELLSRLLSGKSGLTGIMHLAVGDGDSTFSNPTANSALRRRNRHPTQTS